MWGIHQLSCWKVERTEMMTHLSLFPTPGDGISQMGLTKTRTLLTLASSIQQILLSSTYVSGTIIGGIYS